MSSRGEVRMARCKLKRMTPLRELHRHKGSLQFARRLLTAAILLQLPFLIEIVLRQSDLLLHLSILGDRQMPRKVTGVLWASTAIFAIAGFTIVCRQLSLWEGNLEDAELVSRTRLLGTRKIAAGIQFFFYLVFLVPVFSLIPVLWARSQASTAIDDLEQLLPARRR
jgi:hypothetical protein